MRRNRALLLGLVAALAAGTGAVIATTGVLTRAAGATIDARFAVRGGRRVTRVAVVGIDARTLAAAGIPRWPWPRRLQDDCCARCPPPIPA
jgi:CHASE2 domain-containing sensor protein